MTAIDGTPLSRNHFSSAPRIAPGEMSQRMALPPRRFARTRRAFFPIIAHQRGGRQILKTQGKPSAVAGNAGFAHSKGYSQLPAGHGAASAEARPTHSCGGAAADPADAAADPQKHAFNAFTRRYWEKSFHSHLQSLPSRIPKAAASRPTGLGAASAEARRRILAAAPKKSSCALPPKSPSEKRRLDAVANDSLVAAGNNSSAKGTKPSRALFWGLTNSGRSFTCDPRFSPPPARA